MTSVQAKVVNRSSLIGTLENRTMLVVKTVSKFIQNHGNGMTKAAPMKTHLFVKKVKSVPPYICIGLIFFAYLDKKREISFAQTVRGISVEKTF